MRASVFSILLAASVLLGTAHAQFSVGAGLTLLPGVSNYTGTPVGFHLRPRYQLNNNVSIGLNFGASFDSDEVTVGNSSVNNPQFIRTKTRNTWLPVLGSFEYAFGSKKFNPYVGANLGVWINSFSLERTEVNNNSTEYSKFSDSDALFGFGFYGGARYSFDSQWYADASLGFDFTFRSVGAPIFLPINLGVGYRF